MNPIVTNYKTHTLYWLAPDRKYRPWQVGFYVSMVKGNRIRQCVKAVWRFTTLDRRSVWLYEACRATETIGFIPKIFVFPQKRR